MLLMDALVALTAFLPPRAKLANIAEIGRARPRTTLKKSNCVSKARGDADKDAYSGANYVPDLRKLPTGKVRPLA